MLQLLLIGAGGFVGALARYGLGGLVHKYYGGTFPFGTMTINVLGCLVIGGLMTLVEDGRYVTPNLRLLIGVGFLGAFTTFSTFGYETLELVRDGSFWPACANVCGNVVLGLVAVWLGRTLVRTIGG